MFIKAEMPDGDWGLNKNNNAVLDLVIEVHEVKGKVDLPDRKRLRSRRDRDEG